MMRMGMAAAVGAGVSLAAVHCFRRAAPHHLFTPTSSHTACAAVHQRCENDLASARPEGESDWGSPVLTLPQASAGNETVSPSKLPRPRKLFSDREGEDSEVSARTIPVVKEWRADEWEPRKQARTR